MFGRNKRELLLLMGPFILSLLMILFFVYLFFVQSGQSIQNTQNVQSTQSVHNLQGVQGPQGRQGVRNTRNVQKKKGGEKTKVSVGKGRNSCGQGPQELQELRELKKLLQQKSREIEERSDDLETLRKQLSLQLNKKDEGKQRKIQTLAEWYSRMEPKKAAQVMGRIDETLALSVLKRMKKPRAAKVMNWLEPQKAHRLSEKLVETYPL